MEASALGPGDILEPEESSDNEIGYLDLLDSDGTAGTEEDEYGISATQFKSTVAPATVISSKKRAFLFQTSELSLTLKQERQETKMIQ